MRAKPGDLGMYAINVDNCRVGTVAKFMGEPKSRRWGAFVKNERGQFPTLKAAVAFVVETARRTA
jgi:hypothetical protein